MKHAVIIIFTFYASLALGQKGLYTKSPAFEAEVENYLSFSVPLLSVEDLNSDYERYTILDARELKEFETSHLPKAQHIGYNSIKNELLNSLDKSQPIVLYCSIGFRSEKLGEKLKAQGFQKVYNLFGSIFEWVNQGFEVVDKEGNPTNKIHTYDKNWSKWVRNPNVEKVW